MDRWIMQSYRATAIIFRLASTGSIYNRLFLPASGAIAGLKFSSVEALT